MRKIAKEVYNTKLVQYSNTTVVKKYLHNIKSGYKLSKYDIDSRQRKTVEDRTQADIERCIQQSMNRTKNNVYAFALSNDWEWFYTLTFNPQKVDSFDYAAVCKALKAWLDDTRKRYAPDMKYIIVPELHKSGRYHFHGMFSNVGAVPLEYSAAGSTQEAAVYNLPSYCYGFTTATMIKDSDRTCSYCLKYITKELCATTQNKKRYWRSRNLNKPIEYKYNLSDDDFEEQLDGISDNITFAKTIDIPKANNRINLYMTDI